MNIVKYPEKGLEWMSLMQRPFSDDEDIYRIVNDILYDVSSNGDEALKAYALKFDKVELDDFLVTKEEIETAITLVDDELKQAIQQAKSNIEKYHQAQVKIEDKITTMQGVECWRKSLPIERVGLYIPGGTAPLFSTVLMLAIPANIAQCKSIILCSPPNQQGKIHPAILYTAQLCGVHQIYKVGGAQAIAAMAFGTETIPNVYKIFGPGNAFVTKAKELISTHGIAIDMPAGPSEVLVIGDKNANANFIAADLLSQAEHGIDSQVIFLTDDEEKLFAVEQAVNQQLQQLPRKEIATQALENSQLILLHSLDEAMQFSNAYAPEHLILQTENATELAEKVSNAGSVFIGAYTPESAGDYASGTNHTLPTHGYALSYSGVSVDSFMKKISFQHISEIGLQNIGNTIEIMAANEQLQAHKNAVSIRLKSIYEKN
ncbi:MAG: histidinol dehydrogenase [Chitinophagales bacterium]|nr:histidinol dehydrogenase [Chitinophagales bacterium]